MLDIIINGFFQLSFWGYLAYLLIVTQITILAVTVYLHRCQAHRALEMHPILSHFFRFWVWLTTGMNTGQWAAIHRKHHAKCETEEDPHSPQILGLKKVLWQGAELYRSAKKDPELLERYGKGTPDDWMENHLYQPYKYYGVALMLIINLLAFGLIGLSFWGIQMMWIPFWGAGIINGVGHYWGYRNFECPDAARNVSPWGLWIGGEELHNNHHAYPTSAKFSIKPWEFDMGWFFIRIFSAVGLVKVKRVAPKPIYQPNKTMVDVDTLRALISNRFHVLSRYSREVIIPVLKEETCKADEVTRSILSKTKKLLIRETSIIDEHQQQQLAKTLSLSEKLTMVYQLRVKLQQIWQERSMNQVELLEALQEWCKQAEASSIEVLQHFVANLRAYVPAKTTA